jgi:hypothetical protein
MPTTDTSRRLRPAILDKDIDSLHGLGTIPTYSTVRAEATPDALQLAYDQMRVGSRPKPKSSPWPKPPPTPPARPRGSFTTPCWP